MATFYRLLGFLRPYKRGVVVSWVLASFAMAMSVLLPLLTGEAVETINSGASHARRHELVQRRLDDELSSRHDQRAAPGAAPDHAGSPNAARASAGVASPRPKLRAMSATRATCSAFVGSSPVGSGQYQG